MNSLIDRITGKDKLLGQIDHLSKQLKQLDFERNRIRSELNKAIEESAAAHNLINSLKKTYSQLEENYKKISQAYHSKTQELEKLIEEYSVLFSNYTDTKNEIAILQEERNEVKSKLGNLENELSFYENRFGRILESSRSGSSVKATDWDCNFFEAIEKIKGNPFNENQVEAIRYDMEKQLQIIAGAGSGKTETICAKVAYLIQMKNVNPSRICMMTFTKKARGEMEERVNKFLGVKKSNVNVSTFHGAFMSLFSALKRQNSAYAAVGVQGEDPEKGEAKYKEELSKLISKYNLYRFDKFNDKTIFDRISFWVNMGYSGEEMVKNIEKHFNNIEQNPAHPLSYRFELMYQELYQNRQEKEIVVYDDFLINLYDVLQKYQAARDFVQSRYDYIFIDEFQDINPLQVETVKLICPPDCGTRLIIVGDDDQSIYAFRGSDPSYIKSFPKVYDTREIRLMRNYRSKPNIVKAGNWVISYNEHDRINKSMEPFHKENGEAVIVACNDQSDEAHWIITSSEKIGKTKPFKCKRTGKEEQVNYTVSTVLYRSKKVLQSMFQALDTRGVPFVIEKMDDVMGIFSIQEFYTAFKLWFEISKSEGNQFYLWKPVLKNAFGHYFVKQASVEEWYKTLEPSDFSEVVNSALALVKSETRYKEKDTLHLKNYLYLLTRLKTGEKLDMKTLAESFLEFPKTKDMSTEEKDWIKKELEKYNSLNDLLGYYERMKKRKEKMKDDIKRYHKGEHNALYFLTIHGSKGLAFENVFVIGCYDGGLPTSQSVPLKDVDIQSCREKAEPATTEEEERRLMYVAVTRAKERVYVTFPKIVQDKPSIRSKFLGELNLPIKNSSEIK